jgi:hypothetical protein
VGSNRRDGQRPHAQRARATAAGVTASLARWLPRAARPCSRGPAPLRPAYHQAQRLARRSSRPELTFLSGGPAPGVASGRCDDLARAQQTKRSATQWSEAPCASSGPVRQAGPSVAYSRRTSGPAITGHGMGRLRDVAGAAGLAVLREGWKPVRVETRTAGPGLDARTTARPRAAGTRPNHGNLSSPRLVPRRREIPLQSDALDGATFLVLSVP